MMLKRISGPATLAAVTPSATRPGSVMRPDLIKRMRDGAMKSEGEINDDGVLAAIAQSACPARAQKQNPRSDHCRRAGKAEGEADDG